MSDGSRISSSGSTGECPVFKAIGARDLMRAKPDAKNGFLRRRGKRERLAETIKLNNILQWRQVFVVLTDGCLYNYWSEQSTGHFKALVLKGYNRITRVNEWGTECFRIEPADATKKHHVYSCINDSQRKEWMSCIRKEMASANNVSGDTGFSRGSASPDYEDLEQPLYQYASGDSAGMLKSCSEEEGGSDDSDYDQITEWEMPQGRETKRELPPVPNDDAPPVNKGGTLQYAVPNNNNNTTTQSGNRASTLPAATSPKSVPNTRPPPPTPAKPSKGVTDAEDKKHDYINAPEKKTKPKPNPKNVKRTPSEDEYLFNDSNREKALALLKGKAQGTYLIRKARQGDYKVLAVLVDDGKGETKEYKIFTEKPGVTLNHRDYFPNTEALLMAYIEAPLPNHTARLTRPYSTSE